MQQAVSEHARDEFRQEVWDELAGGIALRGGRLRGRGRRGGAVVGRPERRSTRSAARAGNRVYYLAVPPAAIETIVAAMGQHRTAEGWTRLDRREAVRARPGERPAPERGHPHLLRRERDLPHRPLPGQGDGPEHARPAVRERHLRADLEPPVHRPRPDHRRRVARASRAAPGSTSRPARSATSSRTTCSSSSR